ncbi:Glucooligosaccharide oxidase [Glomus cerebriforme]|uniref:Glucooligosaccharide oxidase n=1 Tax=Glomus cerebriforme TaxID=658196 RepID=A0A397TN03_9GLOM|nr:Glucooligosaccharide oxidase [Glomus cerebriforme]
MKLIKQLNIILLPLWCILLISLVNVNASALSSCLASIKGQTVYPNNKTFPSLIIDENIYVNYTPSVLVYAVNNQDVQTSVNCAVKLKMGISARSGGHSYEKYDLGGRNNVMVVDLTNINDIIIDSKSQTAKIGAGNRLGVIYNKLSQAGFLIPAGTCPSVGIGGHALGGGYGFTGRKYGFASDNIISMEMVDANGKLLKIDNATNSDLFFALRGAGGGSYGIVTSFVFHIHPTPPQVTSMKFQFNPNQVQQLFKAYNDVGPSLDNNIVLSISLSKGGLSIDGLYLGPSANAKNAMKQFLSEAPKPTSSKFIPQSFFDSVKTFAYVPPNEVANPKHNPYFFKAKSFLVNKGLTSQAINTMIDFLNNVSCDTYALFDLFGGTANINDVTSSLIHRDVLYGIQLLGQDWNSKTQGDKCIKQLNDFGKEFQSKFTSYFSYQNYIDRDLDDWQTRYYGQNFKRLIEIKAKYDPNNLFNFPQSIPVKTF